jgi:hypothetical protein
MYIIDKKYQPYVASTTSAIKPSYQDHFEFLYDCYHKKLDLNSLHEGAGYLPTEWVEPFLRDFLKPHQCNQIAVFASAQWVPAFDPDIVSINLHLFHEFRLQGELFDVVHRGNLSTLTALLLMKRYQYKANDQALCLAWDQTTVPREINSTAKIPEACVTAALLCSKNKPSHHENSLHINEIQLHQYQNTQELCALIQTLVSQQQISNIHTCSQEILSVLDQQLSIQYWPMPLGCTNCIQWLCELQPKINELGTQKHLWIELDAESPTVGFIIVQAL